MKHDDGDERGASSLHREESTEEMIMQRLSRAMSIQMVKKEEGRETVR